MTEDVETSSESSPRDARLREKIGWICQAVRIAGVVWLLWGIAQSLWVWTRRADFIDKALKNYGIDPATISDFNYWLAYSPVLVTIAFDAFMVSRLWLLVRGYLKGDIFSVEAACRLRTVALAGFAATAVSAIARPMQFALMSPTLLTRLSPWQLILPETLLYALICGFLLALAAIFKAGAEVAEENRQFV